MATIPIEVITDILLLLPAKPLLRFKSVCKEWYNLISGSDFANLHRLRSLATKTNLQFVIQTPNLHLADYDTFENPRELHYPSKNPDHSGVEVVGLCDGLLCVWNLDRMLSLYLYNPTTQTHQWLPFLGINHPFYYYHIDFAFGFGYDSASGAYKCLRILQILDKETGDFESEVMIYSSKTDAWKKGPNAPYYFHNVKQVHALLHETIHWTGEDGHRGLLPIVTFSLKDETFSSLPLPILDGEFVGSMHAGELGGCLCLSLNYYDYYDVWVMKDYGVAGSWRRKFRVMRSQGVEDFERPIGYSLNREKMFFKQLRRQVVSIDTETQPLVTIKVEVAGFNYCSDAHLCVENLEMLPGRRH